MASVARPSRLQHIPLSRTQWIFLSLLVVSICINYIDRGSLSVADRFLQTDFHMPAETRGRIYSAFFVGYAGFMIVAGWLVDRFNVNRVLAAGFLLWSVAMLSTGLATGFATLYGLRVILGIGESVAYPAYSKILAGNFQEQQRGLANAAIDAGPGGWPADGDIWLAHLLLHYGRTQPAVDCAVDDLGAQRSGADSRTDGQGARAA